MTNKPAVRRRASRQQTMEYSNIGSTKLNEVIKNGSIVSKLLGSKVLIDLDSVDSYLESLPSAADPKRAQGRR
jgi:hypothetical protein